MDNAEVLKVLSSKGATKFFHSNSALTSITFLEAGALLSRQYVEKNGLKQTSQPSDAIDKRYGIWNDVFFDTVDIHDWARRKNHYGPVLFVLNTTSVLTDNSLKSTLRIARENPTGWKDGQKDNERYFQTVDEFAKAFSFGDFGKHFMFKTNNGTIALAAHIDHILLDDPKDALGDKSVFDTASKALMAAAKRGKVNVEIRRRECRQGCRCLENYKAAQAAQKAMFAA